MQIFRQQAKFRLRQILHSENYHRLIVDTFPRGLGGELANLLPTVCQPKVLINRYLNPEYIRRYQLRQFVAQYNLILTPGKKLASPFADLPQAKTTLPWLIRHSQELPDLATGRHLLGLNTKQTQPLAIVLASGYQSELSEYGAIAATLHQQGYLVRCISAALPPHCPQAIWKFHYPALECLWLADVVIGSGGYNTVSECSQLNLPLIAIPRPRLYDCQAKRIVAYQCLLAKDRAIAIQLTQQLLSVTKLPTRQPHYRPKYSNGVTEAFTIISNL